MHQVNRNSPRLRDRSRQATRRTILEAAEAAFARRGLRAARMEDVADAAGVAVGTLYNHFADRDALLGALVDARRREVADGIDRALAPRRREPIAAQLGAFVRAAVEQFEAHRPLCALLLDEEQARAGHRAAPAAADLVRRAERLVQEGVSSGALRREDASLYPALLVGMVRALVSGPGRGGRRAPADAVEPVVRLFLRGAAAEKGRSA